MYFADAYLGSESTPGSSGAVPAPSPRGSGAKNPLPRLTQVSTRLFLPYIELADVNEVKRAHAGPFHAGFVPSLRGAETTKIAIAADRGVRLFRPFGRLF
jgi:hypothetical protein